MFSSDGKAPVVQPRDDAGEVHVFRDFERSRIMAIRRAISADPALYTFWFLSVVIVWTVLMSAGAAMHGPNLPAINLTTHVAHFTIILGFFLYPLRLAWIPALSYLLVFLYPFYQPLSNAQPWHEIEGLTTQVVAALFAINLGFGLVQGLIYRAAFQLAQSRLRAHTTDLFLCLASFVVFALVGALQIGVTDRYALLLDAPLRAAMGFDAHFAELAMNRSLRGSAVVAAFLLAAIEYPRASQVLPTIGVMAMFPLLSVIQSQGFVLYAPLDTLALAAVVVFVLPVRVTVFGVLGGIALYAAVTGEFLNELPPADPAHRMLETYALLAIALLLVALAVQSHTEHLLGEKNAAIAKLSRARDFAGVGLFAINRSSGLFRLDDAARRMLSLPDQGDMAILRDSLTVEDAATLSRAMMAGAEPARELWLNTRSGLALHVFLWTETAPSGDPVAYGILLDATVAKERETRLREALDELSLRQERQRQLFSIVSHELRTPASVMSILIDDLPEATDRTRLFRQMREAADQLLSVLGDMRQTVNPEQNLPVKRVSYVPAELAESLRNTLELTAKDHGVTLTVALGAGAGKARIGDVMRLRQALTNLMRNAVIHSRGTVVRLNFTAQPPATEGGPPISQWQVEDDGIGIAPDQVERLFQPFERGEDPRRSADGSGLGLFIARQSVEMLGGTLEYYQPLRGGAGYMLRLPEPLADESTPRPAAKPPAAKAPPPRPRSLRPWTVVLAEDNTLVADVTRARLERLGATVRVAENGAAALNMVAEQAPDILITDLFMPELDGDDLVRRLRKQGYSRPVVGLTAAVVGEEMLRFRRAGTNVVMQKPLDFGELERLMTEGFPAAAEPAAP